MPLSKFFKLWIYAFIILLSTSSLADDGTATKKYEPSISQLRIGLLKKDVEKFYSPPEDWPIRKTSRLWRFNKPYGGLLEIKFDGNDRICELGGNWILLEGFQWGLIKRGYSQEFLYSQGMPGGRLEFWSKTNTHISWLLKNENYILAVDHRGIPIETEERNLKVEIFFREGLVEYITLSLAVQN